MVPYIMGGTPTFENSGTGPTVKIDFQEKPNFEKTQVIYDSIQEVKSKNSKPLLGFSGGSWSTLLYCLFGANERKIISQKLISEKEEQIKNNINKVTDVIILHAIKQAESGIDAFQIFESWSGLLNDEQFEEWCVEPAKKITEEIKKLNVQTIGFPRETSLNNYVKYSNIETLDCISLDTKFSLSNISKLNQNICFQGNLDPLILLGGGEELKNKAMEILTIFKNHPHIFNLGHGVLPDTKIENIITLIEAVKKK
jgi:uroporphyrinogen decarboxylase